MKKLRAKTHGIEHTVATILANPLAHRLMQSMHVFVTPVRSRHGQAMTTAHTPWGTMDFRIECALGSWTDELLEIVSLTGDEHHLVDYST